VGNLSYQTTAPVLGKLFETIGDVVNATIASHFNSSKGFGFVELKDEAVAKEAVEKLNNHELDGRFLSRKSFLLLIEKFV
jgi:RNA recognition motif-containing protein